MIAWILVMQVCMHLARLDATFGVVMPHKVGVAGRVPPRYRGRRGRNARSDGRKGCMKTPTPRQQEFIAFIRQYNAEHKYPPNVRDIRDHFGFASPSGVQSALNALKQKGYVTWDHGKSRTLRLVNDQTTLIGIEPQLVRDLIDCLASVAEGGRFRTTSERMIARLEAVLDDHTSSEPD